MGAFCIVTTEPDFPRDLTRMDEACLRKAKSLLLDLLLESSKAIWLLVAHGPWQPRSAAVRHSRLWNSFWSRYGLRGANLSPEIMVESDEGIRFAGVAMIDSSALFTGTQILRQQPSCALIISGRTEIPTEHGIRQLFEFAFPIRGRNQQAEVDWLCLSLGCCPLGDVIVRVSGGIDDRETALDFIMSSQNLSQVEKKVQNAAYLDQD